MAGINMVFWCGVFRVLMIKINRVDNDIPIMNDIVFSRFFLKR